MKTAIVAFATSLAVAHAQGGPEPGDVPINCAQANANYCFGGDIILRCDENGMGLRGRCSANLVGYPPSGGSATCWESSVEAGDAACQKNCVVYADEPFTLSTDECEPSHSAPLETMPSVTNVIPEPIPTSTIATSYTQPTQPPYVNVTSTWVPLPPPGPTQPPSDVPPPPTSVTWPNSTIITIPIPPGPTPGEPGSPGQPGNPENPGSPGSPGSPSSSGAPGTPSSPTLPGTPGSPTSPGTPGGPDAPSGAAMAVSYVGNVLAAAALVTAFFFF
jgi:hypothetical protein